MSNVRLGVNIDHIATLRNCRHEVYPDPLAAMEPCLQGGADLITVHLREDRRHIRVDDVRRLMALKRLPINLEMAADDAMIDFACQLKPKWCCLVPEKRQELTTEGGLDVASLEVRLTKVVATLHGAGISVSLFVDPDHRQIDAAKRLGVAAVELHTGDYANAKDGKIQLARLYTAAGHTVELGLQCHAGHGLNVDNIAPVAACSTISEFNIGHAIIARAVFIGLQAAVDEMRQAINQARALSSVHRHACIP